MRRTFLAVAAVLAASACAAGYHESVSDPQVVNRDPAELIVFPEWVGNVYTKCDHGNRLYVHLDTGSLDAIEGGCSNDR